MRTLWLALFLTLGLAQAQAQAPVVFPAPSSPQLTPLTQSTSGTGAASLSVTIPGGTSKYTYICGFVASSGATSPTTGATSLYVTGLGNQLAFIYNFVNPGQGILGVAFPGCLSTATQATSITIQLIGIGSETGGSDALSAWGYTN